ncbi:Replication factor C, subunit RFC1 (large subunit) [Trachipleistophora hominis]|uniref:Replication factor C, subunit RFC1 (Large subunit) n=1 Tax=Trachipleistophora hominis TaxID=72359 RepID=L7JWF2_TRAHO|nr:Replication factor C, subunit RFC1 (large subunit) [Trachipleistophora hominis]
MEKVMVNWMNTRSDSAGSAYNYADESNYGTLWTVKYEPRSLDEVLGNKTAKEHILSFLEQHTPGKALLIAGPPGVGKSLCVKLACASTVYEMTEFNASDVRNKGSLSERVRQFVNCACISGKRRALVMDECDGMTGDRGGMPELVQIIKNARMPVICICNDKYAVRPLASVCEEVTFRKLETRQILGRIRDILKSEHRAVTDKEIVEVCAMANNDMRYILNCLQGRVMYTKVVSRTLFDEVLALFGRGTAAEKIETFFQDYEMMPMMVYENYLRSEVREDGHVKKDRVNAHKHNKTTKNTRINVYELGESDWHRKMRTYAHASDSISLADTYLRKMGSNDWSLLNQYAVFGALIPAQNIKINRRIEFPKILGNTSKGNKHNKIIQTFHFHILSRCDPTEFYFYDMPLLIKTYIANLNDGHIDKNVQFLVENKLLKSDCDDGMSVYGWEKNVSTKGKSAMTRAYKKLKRSLPYNDDE